MNIIKEIGMPAMLEQLGEECCELGQAALKLSRKYRDENPTPKNLDVCINELGEEMADVMMCIEKIVDSGLVSHESIESWQMMKEARWAGRIAEHKAEKSKKELAIMGVYMKGE